ncbi:MAG TPA: T9SS type A sorting domain-containing protein [Bacteroidia bacterium]|jgi:hypothetical protein|nr:T9SS type A sorting domain-containing protein [Bacteroidia bacterium]
MKQSITLIFAIIFSTALLAQSEKTLSSGLLQQRAYVESMLQHQLKQDLKKKGPIHMESLKAQSTRDNTKDSLTDSVRIMFGAIDTSIYDYNVMVYPYNYPYSTSPVFNNNLGNFTRPKIWFSSYYHWTVDPNTLDYGFYQEEFRGMDFHKNIFKDTALYADSSFIANMTYANNFDVTNNVISSYSFLYKAGISDSAYKQFFTYTSGNLTKDSTYGYSGGTWHLVSKTFYTYDVSNNLVQIDNYANTDDTTFTKPLPEQFQYVNTYDGSHRMLTVNIKQYDGLNLKPYVADTFAYTGAYTYHTSWKEYQYDLIQAYWAPMTYMTKHINVNGLPDSINIDAFDSVMNKWVPYTKYIVKYDSLKNPARLLSYQYNFVSFPATPNFTTIYYYNYILDPNSVNNVSSSTGSIIIYPNPAKESVTLSGINSKNSEVSITLFDMQGRICGKEYLTTLNGSLQLHIDYLASGTYLLSVQDETGASLGRKLMVKQ